ncbi:MAG: nucleotide pyrophosphohydrolase [Candidatus Sungbacteria bacterium]|uniref:Nucleotide pyrophosphohydrolase n=1 Tax=Candidatus Sungiibacteriota bacterium TaxID=2750080 RepID=A0A9D6QYR2_9BACT|nr:nucleotide pyrophosphohydrolase [Candidatus Sungbacteria bacterium]
MKVRLAEFVPHFTGLGGLLLGHARYSLESRTAVMHQVMQKQQQEIDSWFKEKGWSYWSPLSILARLMEETGEFARLVNHLFGDKPKRSEGADQRLEDELGDILYTLACFGNSHNIDLDAALQKSIDKVNNRDSERKFKN